MRIDLNRGPQQLPKDNLNARTTGPGEASLSSASALGEDQAQLSGAHVQVAALAAQASQLPELRQERVEALRAAVASGQYHSTPEQVAGSVVEHMVIGSAA